MDLTKHAKARQQQRGVSPRIRDWLCAHGAKSHDHRGAVIRYFDKRARRRVLEHFGADAAGWLDKHVRTYVVLDAAEETIITVGKRYIRIPR